MYKFTNGVVVYDEATRDKYIKSGMTLVKEEKLVKMEIPVEKEEKIVKKTDFRPTGKRNSKFNR